MASEPEYHDAVMGERLSHDRWLQHPGDTGHDLGDSGDIDVGLDRQLSDEDVELEVRIDR